MGHFNMFEFWHHYCTPDGRWIEDRVLKVSGVEAASWAKTFYENYEQTPTCYHSVNRGSYEYNLKDLAAQDRIAFNVK